MEDPEGIRRVLRGLLSTQRLAVLSTHAGGQPYASLVAFACSEDLRFLHFVTPRTTRKFGNLQNDGRMALLVTSSANQEVDFHEAMAVTVVGSAGEISGPEKEAALERYLGKHPYLEAFARSPTCAFVQVHARTYILVKNFQHVMELHLEP
ncbi:MAG: pyridoxamine 5'-phosphate oxidase family protein [Desulfobacterales bacterium]|jgi:nitroimidazol reductase NimA-like FMN-containing flavoprotein (pyridoxamine 5'-phosphate oxidase superfamily)|nr:pyridoxamine 5'-phosphate oxidase family protein [Desulfobacterales bacterium]